MTFLEKQNILDICENIKDISHEFENKRILITGSNGFLGKYFSSVFNSLNEKYLKNKCNVLLMDNLIVPNDYDKSLSDNFMYMEYDITEPFDFCNFLEKDIKFDYIINAAGIASPYWYNKFQMETIEVGVDGLRNVLELSLEHNAKLLFFSSSEVYGTPPDQFVPTSEDYVGQIPTLTKRSAYDISKLMGETLVYVYNDLGANAVIVRPFNFTGPGMSQNDQRVMPNFISKIIKDEPIIIYGSGEQTRSICDISDAISGCLKVLVNGKSGEAYNIGNPETELSINNLVTVMEDVLDKKIKVEKIPSPINYITEPLRRCPNINKAKSIGYEPKTSIQDTILNFYNWAKKTYK